MCPGYGAARNKVERCAADPGPQKTVMVHASRAYPTCAHLSTDLGFTRGRCLQRTTTQSSVRRLRKLISVAALRPGHIQSLRPDACRPDHLAPLLDLGRHVAAELGRGEQYGRGGDVGEHQAGVI